MKVSLSANLCVGGGITLCGGQRSLWRSQQSTCVFFNCFSTVLRQGLTQSAGWTGWSESPRLTGVTTTHTWLCVGAGGVNSAHTCIHSEHFAPCTSSSVPLLPLVSWFLSVNLQLLFLGWRGQVLGTKIRTSYIFTSAVPLSYIRRTKAAVWGLFLRESLTLQPSLASRSQSCLSFLSTAIMGMTAILGFRAKRVFCFVFFGGGMFLRQGLSMQPY